MAEPKTEQEVSDQLQKEAKEKSEARQKLVDKITNMLHEEMKKGVDLHGLQAIVDEIKKKLDGFQVIAAGAEYGPSPATLEALKKQEFPILTPPMSDGTPVANIAQAKKPGEKPEEPVQYAPTPSGKPQPSTSKK